LEAKLETPRMKMNVTDLYFIQYLQGEKAIIRLALVIAGGNLIPPECKFHDACICHLG